MDFVERSLTFEEANRYFVRLKELHDGGIIRDEEFGDLIRRLMVQDAGGRWWAKSRKTGEWHYHDGNAWLKGTPPLGRKKPERESEVPAFRKPSMDELLEICARYEGPEFYVGDSIPERALRDARTYFPIPPDEGVAALVHYSPKYGLAICEGGIRWRWYRGIFSDARGVVEWPEYANVSIQTSRARVRIGERLDFVIGDAADTVMDHRQFVSLLQEIQASVMGSPSA